MTSQQIEKTTSRNMAELGIVRLSKNATLPIKATKDSIGYDLFSAESVVIEKQDKALIATDIRIVLPKGCYGRIAARSGMSFYKHCLVGAGVIDRDFTGQLKVLLFNLGQKEIYVHLGDRIAQLICEQALSPPIKELDDAPQEDDDGTDNIRKMSGFGSSGGF